MEPVDEIVRTLTDAGASVPDAERDDPSVSHFVAWLYHRLIALGRAVIAMARR